MENTAYLTVPYNILNNKELTLSAKILLAEIISLSKPEGYCYASNEYLAKRVGISVTTIKKSLKILKQKGCISSKMINPKERLIYPCQAGIRPLNRAESAPSQGEKRPRIRAKSDHNNNIYNNNYNNNYKRHTKRDFWGQSDASYDIEELMKIK